MFIDGIFKGFLVPLRNGTLMEQYVDVERLYFITFATFLYIKKKQQHYFVINLGVYCKLKNVLL